MKPVHAASTLAVAAVVGLLAVAGRGQYTSTAPPPASFVPVATMGQPATSTRLEAMLNHASVVVVRGYTDVGTLQGDQESAVSVVAVELSHPGQDRKAYGLAIGVRQGDRATLTYVDDDEAESLIAGLDYLGRMDNSATRLTSYEGQLRTKAGMEIANVSSSGSRVVLVKGVEFVPEVGQPVWATAQFPIGRIADVRQLIVAGKDAVERARK